MLSIREKRSFYSSWSAFNSPSKISLNRYKSCTTHGDGFSWNKAKNINNNEKAYRARTLWKNHYKTKFGFSIKSFSHKLFSFYKASSIDALREKSERVFTLFRKKLTQLGNDPILVGIFDVLTVESSMAVCCIIQILYSILISNGRLMKITNESTNNQQLQWDVA